MSIAARPWTQTDLPTRVLAIRLQAMGDVVITLPYLQHLRDSLPTHVQLDMLTRRETEDIPRNVVLFNKVFSLGGGRSQKLQLLDCFRLLPSLMSRRYDMVLDLQNNTISRVVRKFIAPKCWVEFDKYSPLAAGERNRLTIEAAGFVKNEMKCGFQLRSGGSGLSILQEAGFTKPDQLVILNPAGFFSTRNWPLHNYVEFANLWLDRNPDSKFLLLGTRFIEQKAIYLEKKLGSRIINLVGKTTPAEAFAIIQKADLCISEDSGLMHMSWVSGIPTITIFGSTRSDWSRPLGLHSFFFDSSDLPCGNCMGAQCRMHDLRCLTRVTPEMVFEKAITLVDNKSASKVRM